MVSALVVGSNTYVDVAYFQAYLADSVRAAETALEIDDETAARLLITAFRILERQTWGGSKTDPDQDAQFPRTGLVRKDGTAVDDNTVPIEIEHAQCELGFDLYLSSALETSGGTGNDKRRVRADTVEVEYFRPSGSTNGVGGPRFGPHIMELIGAFLAGAVGGLFGGTFVSGGVDESAFTDENSLDLGRGLT